ncbi:MAG: glycosyltransferase family 4 protein [Burkholderiales bacterium]
MHSSADLDQELPAVRSSLTVAIVTETYPPEVNGVALTLARLANALERRGHRVQLIRPRQSALDRPAGRERLEEVLVPGIPIPRYNGLRIGLPAGRTLRRLWQLKRPDVVHVATEGPLGWSALAAAARLKLPVASGFHTNFHSYSAHYGFGFLGKPIARYLRGFHNKARATMVPTADLKRELESRGYRNVRVVSRGVDSRLFDPARRNGSLRRGWGASETDLVALHVGRLAPEKNLRLAVRAAEAMRAANPRLRMVWVGDGPEREVMQRALSGHVFAGMRTGEDLAAYYASADLFLFPSTTETFGNVTLEAMASALAVIAYDYAAAAQHIEHGVSGLLAPLGDEAAFVRHAIETVVSTPRLAGLRASAREAARRVDWDNVYGDYERVLLEVVQEAQTARA